MSPDNTHAPFPTILDIDEDNFHELTLPAESAGKRLDKMLAHILEDISREKIKTAIISGNLSLDGNICKDPSYKISGGEYVSLTIAPPPPSEIKGENIPLNIVFEDDYLLVIDKQAGLVVHPGAGNYTGTLVNALIHHCGDNISSGGAGNENAFRSGIVHRLDKETSGLMLAAKTDSAQVALTKALARRQISRKYHALVLGVPIPPIGSINAGIARSKREPIKMCVSSNSTSRSALTHYRILQDIAGRFSLLECTLSSGRTHQIRVHMSHIRHNIIGDPLYGAPKTSVISAIVKAENLPEEQKQKILTMPRQALHSAELSFIHPANGEEMSFSSPMPEDIKI